MNRHYIEIQGAIAELGDHLGRVQLLVRNLVESRHLSDGQLDPEIELAVICWLEETRNLTGVPHDPQARQN